MARNPNPRNPAAAAIGNLQRTVSGLSTRVSGLAALDAQAPGPKPGSPPAMVRRTIITGRADAMVAPRPPVILEAAELEPLGVAGRRSWYRHGDGELRVDTEVGAEATSDSLPAGRVIVHRVERVADQTVETGDPKQPRKLIKGHRLDRYYRASLVPPGAHAAALAHDARRRPRVIAPALREPTRATVFGPANAASRAFWNAKRAGRPTGTRPPDSE